MTKLEYMLVGLMEECAEVQKVCSKALRFGLDHTNWKEPDNGTNRQKLKIEINDFVAHVELLQEHGILPEEEWLTREAVNAKKKKFLARMEEFGNCPNG